VIKSHTLLATPRFTVTGPLIWRPHRTTA